jgi:hypothetical protein
MVNLHEAFLGIFLDGGLKNPVEENKISQHHSWTHFFIRMIDSLSSTKWIFSIKFTRNSQPTLSQTTRKNR